jgi:hypothetical protein
MRREVDMKIKGEVRNKTDKLAKKCFEMMKEMYSNEYSELLDIFYGIHVSVIEKDEKTLSIKPEPYFIIDLPLDLEKSSINIKDCFKKYCASEIIEDWKNEETNELERCR